MEFTAKFVAEYECVECGEEIDVEGMFFPEIALPCDECGVSTTFRVIKVISQSVLGFTVEDKL